MTDVGLLRTESHTKDALCKRQKHSLTVNVRPEFFMAQEEGIHQGRNPLVPPVAQQPTPESKDPRRVPGAEPHRSCVSTRNTFVLFSCSVFDSLCIDIFIRGMFSLCLSKRLVCVFQYVFLSFVASAWRMWNFLFLANQTNDTIVVVNKPLVVNSFWQSLTCSWNLFHSFIALRCSLLFPAQVRNETTALCCFDESPGRMSDEWARSRSLTYSLTNLFTTMN